MLPRKVPILVIQTKDDPKNHKAHKEKTKIPSAGSSWLSKIELLKCIASLYGNLEAPKETPREAKSMKTTLLVNLEDQNNERDQSGNFSLN